jgi:hypothetical protein
MPENGVPAGAGSVCPSLFAEGEEVRLRCWIVEHIAGDSCVAVVVGDRRCRQHFWVPTEHLIALTKP